MLSLVLLVAWVTPPAEYQLFPLQVLFSILMHFHERCRSEAAAIACTDAFRKLAEKLDQVAMLGINFRNADAAFFAPFKCEHDSQSLLPYLSATPANWTRSEIRVIGEFRD